MLRDEDLEQDEDEDEEEEEEDEDDSLTSGSQVSCSFIWGSVNQAGFSQGDWHPLSWRPLLAGQWHCGPQAEPRLWARTGLQEAAGSLQPQTRGVWFHSPGARPFPGHWNILIMLPTSNSPAACTVPAALAFPRGHAVPLPGAPVTCPGSGFLLSPVRSGASAHTQFSWCRLSSKAWALTPLTCPLA